jgi:hypothetical protein
MSAGRYNFYIEQGATFKIDLAYKDSNGDPVDLSYYTGRMQIRPSVTSDTVYLTLSSDYNSDGTGLHFSGSNDNLPPASGTVGVIIASCTSSELSWGGDAYYDLELYSGSGDCAYTIRLIEGRVRLSNEVTR